MMIRPSRLIVLALLVMPCAVASARAGDLDGIGVIGDSYSDEYQFYPPDRAAARNWVEILAETRGLNFGRFSTQGRGEPRNQGYEFNWARSDATTEDAIATGQHTGLAAQVARGEVTLVCVFIGGNDFIHALSSSDPDGALRAVPPRALANLRTTVRTILDASPDVKLVLGTIPDIRDLPEFDEPIQTGRLPLALADDYTAAIEQYNAQIRSLVLKERRIGLMDLALATKLANLMGRDQSIVAGRTLDRKTTGNDLGHVFLADRRHVGTLTQGMIARLFVLAVRGRFGADVAPLRDREIVAAALAVPAPRAIVPVLTNLNNPPRRQATPHGGN